MGEINEFRLCGLLVAWEFLLYEAGIGDAICGKYFASKESILAMRERKMARTESIFAFRGRK